MILKNSLSSIVFNFVTTPLSITYDFVTQIRRFLYSLGIKKQITFKVPIISIGNLTMGGTGKTPLTLWIGKFLESKNKKTMILMRGYKSLLESKSGYIPSQNKIGYSAKEYGDEAILYKKKLLNSSVVVGRNRALNLLKFYKKEEADVILLDDGHQHIQVFSDLNILLFDASLPLSKYRVVPRGYLRESLKAITTSDVIIINRCELVSKEKIASLLLLITKYSKNKIPIFKTQYTFNYIYNKDDQIVYTPVDLKGRKVVAFAGIANNENFFANLRKQDVQIIETFSFSDHHLYLEDELIEIMDLATASNSIVITTEKDIVKLGNYSASDSIYYLGMLLEFLVDADQKNFEQILSQKAGEIV